MRLGTNTDSFSQTLLNFAQLPAGSPDIPQVVTSSLVSGVARSSVPVWGFGGSHPGVVANDPISHGGGAFNGMKAAFAQFLTLRHGERCSGTRLLFSATARAAIPFAQLPRHQLHGHAAGHAAAGSDHVYGATSRYASAILHG